MKITVDVSESTDQIILHSNQLTINQLSLIEPNITLNKFYQDSVREFLIIDLKEELSPGNSYKLNINFEGSMEGKIVGLYSSSYKKADGSKK